VVSDVHGKSGPSGARKRKIGHAQVITSSPYKTALEESSSARPKSKIKKGNVAERKRQTSKKPKVPGKLQIPRGRRQNAMSLLRNSLLSVKGFMGFLSQM
jgi:hypothetical protein